MTTAPADEATITEAHRPRPGHHFTTVQRVLIAVVTALVLVIAGIGFAGSYAAVSHLAAAKGFGGFAKVFPIGLDSGIGAFLALDLLLTWLRIPFPLLRYGAWALTVATVAFNAAAAWPDPLGVGMHAVIPVLFVIAVEAARHAVGRIADITADKHTELPPIKRWLVAPWPTFRLWRRQILWDIRSYEQAIVCERQLGVFRARLKTRHGRAWRRKASPEELLTLRLAARGGLTVAEAIDLPRAEADALAEAEAKRAARTEVVRAEAEAEALRVRAQAEAEAEAAARSEAEAKRLAEAKLAEAEATARTEALREAEAGRILKAETEAKLAEIARRQEEANLQAEARQQAYLDEQSARRQALQQAAQAEAEAKRLAEATARTEAAARTEALRVPARTEAKPAAEATRTRTEATNPKRLPEPKPAASLGGARTKKQAETEAVLQILKDAGDPKALSLEDVKDRFGLKHAAAWDRLSTARGLWSQDQQQSA